MAGYDNNTAGTWVCSCGKTNAGKFCAECGAPRPAARPVSPQASRVEWMCTCGERNNGKFCIKCGAPRTANLKQAQTYPQQQQYPQQSGVRQSYPQQGYAQRQQAQMQPQPQQESEPPKPPSLMAQIKAGVMDIIQHPAKLLPTIILAVLWMVISLLMAMGKDLAVVRWLNTLTYASGGMYGGALGAAGGIFGKAVFAAVVNTIILSLWAGRNPFARDEKGQSLMRKATSSGMAMVAPFLIGLGASLVLYYFFNVTSSTKNVMVGVMAAIGAIQAAQSSHGIIFSIVLFIAGKASGGRAPSSTAVRNSLLGATAGFALGVPLTFLHQPLLIVSAGFAVLLLGILLAVLGQQKKPAQA